MARLSLLGETSRAEFRKTLTSRQDRALDELVWLLQDPKQDDLHWYHRIGEAVKIILPGSEAMRGNAWFAKLSQALGPAPSLFYKALRFVRLYSNARDVDELNQLGIGWTRLTLTFVIKDGEKRNKLLRRAAAEDWSIYRLRCEIAQRFPSNRRGVGGRPRRDIKNYGLEVSLEELIRQSESWLHYFDAVWVSDVNPIGKQLKKLNRRKDQSDRLRELLEKSSDVIHRLVACGKVVSNDLKQVHQRNV